MHAKSSINIKPVSGNSEAHNLRTGQKLNYVDYDRTELNQSWEVESIHDARTRIEKTYLENVGQKMQAKATPLREGVMNLNATVDMHHIKDTCKKLNDRFGVKAIQIHIHEDEGHHRVKSGEWKQNRHAHIVFDWTNDQGKSIKLNKKDMSEMQTIVAESLGMERGQSSDKVHLSSMEYKRQEIEKDILEMEQELKTIKSQIKKQEFGKNTNKAILTAFDRLTGKSSIEKLKSENQALKIDNATLYKEALELKDDNARMQESIREKARISSEMAKLKAEKDRLQKLNQEKVQAIQQSEKNAKAWQNNFKKVVTGEVSIERAKEFAQERGLLNDQNRSKGYGIGH